MVLKPRTKPVEGEEGEEKEEGEVDEDEEEEGEEEEETAAEEPSMPKEEADRLIKTRVAEFYNVKVRLFSHSLLSFSLLVFDLDTWN